ncbi:hypothetical protein AVEN_17536-1 [Araneus ventricosus]|uniref:Uncharacterized protein n=1 Tax=Araneus ventricosus TaxID=182803 RepID=A0A4Y2HFB1_ARAVE|nr:hypothetical protein AVEN_17536-1 [Araneus ventricosus]
MFCQWCDRIYSTSTKNLVLTCLHDVHKCCAKHLDRRLSLCLKCMKPLTDMDEIRRVSRDVSIDDDASSTDSWTNSLTDSSMDSSTDDEMNASPDEFQAM